MGESQAILEVKDLHTWFRTYRGLLRVLNGVSLSVRRGERVGLVGEAGCGKTTTLRAIMGILPREARVPKGQILFEGRDVLTMSRKELARFRRLGASMIFQDPTAALNPVLTLGELLGDVLRYSGVKGPEVTRRAIQALKDVSLPDPQRMLRSYPFQLSGGMRQRACIGIAVSGKRKLLLADEPGTSLDVTIQDQILNLISRLVKERDLSVLLVSHSLGVVREHTERVYVMYAGNVVEVADTGRLFANPCHPYTKALLGCVPKLTGSGISRGIAGAMPDYLSPPTGCRFAPRCPSVLPVCLEHRPEMRETEQGHSVACFLYGAPEAGDGIA